MHWSCILQKQVSPPVSHKHVYLFTAWEPGRGCLVQNRKLFCALVISILIWLFPIGQIMPCQSVLDRTWKSKHPAVQQCGAVLLWAQWLWGEIGPPASTLQAGIRQHQNNEQQTACLSLPEFVVGTTETERFSSAIVAREHWEEPEIKAHFGLKSLQNSGPSVIANSKLLWSSRCVWNSPKPMVWKFRSGECKGCLQLCRFRLRHFN